MKNLLRAVLRSLLALLAINTIVRLVRRYYKFPTPAALTRMIDNPLRYRFLQDPEEALDRMGIQPGQQVLEIGPGAGTLAIAAARRVGEDGQVMAVDIQPEVVAQVRQRAWQAEAQNLHARLASVYALPFPEASFDAAYLVMVYGEIPEPQRMLAEIHRVLRPGGTLALTEFAPDPDYSRDVTLIRDVSPAGFQVVQETGNPLLYTLLFERTERRAVTAAS